MKHYPDKQDRKHVLAALTHGVEKKLFVKAKGSYRLSKKASDALKKSTKKSTKKATTKKTTTKKTTKKTTTKKTATKKKATTKKATTKKTTEKSPKKTSTKKRVAEDTEEAPKKTATPKKSKKVIGPSATDELPTGEARGVWQYYDNGWFDYAAEAIRIVEGVFQEFNADSSLVIRDIQSGHFKYSVNFNTMEQTNAQTGTMRKIRRV